MSPSADYSKALELSKAQHRETKTYSGKFLRPYRKDIKKIIDRLNCGSVLDYGCGKGLQYEWTDAEGRTLEQLWDISVVKYDPAHPAFDKEPDGSYDLVICTHVLGVIPIPDLNWVVDRLYGLANKALFVVVAIDGISKPSKQKYRLDSVPSAWGADDWINLLTSRKAKTVEAHLVVTTKDPAKKSGTFVI